MSEETQSGGVNLSGDMVSGDKVAGDFVGRDNAIFIGRDIPAQQIINIAGTYLLKDLGRTAPQEPNAMALSMDNRGYRQGSGFVIS